MSLTYFLVHSQSSNELRQIVGSVDYWFFYLYLKEVMKVWKLKIWVLPSLSLPNKEFIYWNKPFFKR